VTRPQVNELKKIMADVDEDAFIETIGMSHQALGVGLVGCSTKGSAIGKVE
jgi:uncharacterized membrane-anchored protein YitT (DUF2179 family)